MLGELSIVLCAPITAPLALWKAARALRTHTYLPAAVAIALAIFGLRTSAFLWFLAIWQILSPGR